MPIYEYKCDACGNLDEHLMRLSDPDPTGCTKCGLPVHKIVSQTSFSLKGTGWYVTDYKKQNGAEPAADAPAVTPATSPASPATSSSSDSATTPAPAATPTPTSGAQSGSKGGSGTGN